MPPPATHRLGLLVLPGDPDAPEDGIRRLAERWAGETALVDGGHRPPRLEGDGALRFVANRQGGFRVDCPEGGGTVTAAFVPALTGWRAGGPRTLACPCGRTHDLAALRYRPEAGFARRWIVLDEVGGVELRPEAAALAKELWGGMRIVLRRG